MYLNLLLTGQTFKINCTGFWYKLNYNLVYLPFKIAKIYVCYLPIANTYTKLIHPFVEAHNYKEANKCFLK